MAHEMTPAEVKHHVKVYIRVFITLLVLTVVTVVAAELHIATVGIAVAIALVIALVKGSLVARYFMHLASERGMIFWVLILCVLFFFTLLLVPVFVESETVNRTLMHR